MHEGKGARVVLVSNPHSIITLSNPVYYVYYCLREEFSVDKSEAFLRGGLVMISMLSNNNVNHDLTFFLDSALMCVCIEMEINFWGIKSMLILT